MSTSRPALCIILALVSLLLTPVARAATPACGTTLSTAGETVTFDSDMVCPAGFIGTALTITADDVIVDGAGFRIEAPQAARGVWINEADRVSVADLTISPGAERGVDCQVSVGSTLTNITSTGTVFGIHLDRVTGTTISGCTLTDNSHGIHGPDGGSSNVISGNDVSRCAGNGIAYTGSDSQITGNSGTNCGTGLSLRGSNNVVDDNDFSGANTSNPGDNRGIYTVESGPNSFTNNDVSGHGTGIHFNGTSPAFTLSGNDLTACHTGIIFQDMSGIDFRNRDFTPFGITSGAIRLFNVDDSTFANITATGMLFGIRFQYVTNTTISGCTLTDNSHGIHGEGGGSSNVISGNDVSRCTGNGIFYNGAADSQITGNTGTGCGMGLWLTGANNVVDGNDFSGANTSSPGDNRGIYSDGAGPDSFTNNDVSGHGTGVHLQGTSPAFTLSGNDLTACHTGIFFQDMSGIDFRNRDFTPFGITSRAIHVRDVDDSTFANITATGMLFGIFLHYVTDTTISGCTFTDNSHGIWENEGSSSIIISGNDVSRCAGNGIHYTDRFSEITGNTGTNCGTGLSLGGANNVAIENDFSGCVVGINAGALGAVIAGNDLSDAREEGLHLEGGVDVQVRENLIANGLRDGIVIRNEVTPRIYHNNIFGNGRYEVTSTDPIELSFNGEGNYWGRSCPGPLFVSGTDSNANDVVDTFPYGEQDGWLTGATPVRCDCIEPPAGVVAWWLGDGNAEDLVSGLNGTLTGGATFAPGQVGQAFLLDGLDDIVETPAAAPLSFGFGAFSVEGWIRPASLAGAGGDRWIVSRESAAGDAGFRLGISGGSLLYRDLSGGSMVAGATDLTAGAWTHVALVRGGPFPNQTQLWVNGALDGTGTSQGNFDDALPLLIGRAAGETVDFFEGHVDELAVYGRALLPAEIADLYSRDGKCAVPTADAGEDQSVDETELVALDGAGSVDPRSYELTYTWVQVAGTSVMLDLTNPALPTFTAPIVPPGGETLTFALVVSSDSGTSVADTVDVVVKNVNHLPVADAGDEQTVAEGTLVTLDGSMSYDTDGETLTYGWVQVSGPPVTLSGADTATPSFTAPEVGAGGDTVVLRLTVSDGLDSTTSDVEVRVSNVNQAPTADAGEEQTADELTLVTLDGTASDDPDGDTLSYAWTQVGGPPVLLSDATSPTPTFTAPLVGPGGQDVVFALVVSDGEEASDPVQVTVHVMDTNDPPDCTLARASAGSLWPPSHKMVQVLVLGVSDPNGNPVTITVTGVTQDEPVNGLGDGDTSPDAIVNETGVLLRAERQGGGNGRVYRVSFTADDGLGGTCTGSLLVETPHDRNRPAIDDGQFYDSTGGQ